MYSIVHWIFWKLFVSAFLDTLYHNIQGLVIGKKYDAESVDILTALYNYNMEVVL